VKAGIACEDCWLHKWRVTYCVELLRDGMDLASVQVLMGQKDLASTARYVAPLRKAALKVRVDKIKSFNFKSSKVFP